eukprot:704640-Prymnesium_polylepis.2
MQTVMWFAGLRGARAPRAPCVCATRAFWERRGAAGSWAPIVEHTLWELCCHIVHGPCDLCVGIPSTREGTHSRIRPNIDAPTHVIGSHRRRARTSVCVAAHTGPLSFALAVTLDDQRLPLPLDAGLVHRVMWATLVTIAASTWLMAPATAPLIGSLPSLAPASRSANGLQDALLPQPSPPSLLVEPDDAPPFRSPQRPLKSTFGETSLEAGSGGATASRIAVGASAEPYDDAPRPHSPARYNEALEPPVLLHRLFRRLDAAFLKPIFGGNGSTPP